MPMYNEPRYTKRLIICKMCNNESTASRHSTTFCSEKCRFTYCKTIANEGFMPPYILIAKDKGFVRLADVDRVIRKRLLKYNIIEPYAAIRYGFILTEHGVRIANAIGAAQETEQSEESKQYDG
jgi:hypothetical protein